MGTQLTKSESSCCNPCGTYELQGCADGVPYTQLVAIANGEATTRWINMDTGELVSTKPAGFLTGTCTENTNSLAFSATTPTLTSPFNPPKDNYTVFVTDTGDETGTITEMWKFDQETNAWYKVPTGGGVSADAGNTATISPTDGKVFVGKEIGDELTVAVSNAEDIPTDYVGDKTINLYHPTQWRVALDQKTGAELIGPNGRRLLVGLWEEPVQYVTSFIRGAGGVNASYETTQITVGTAFSLGVAGSITESNLPDGTPYTPAAGDLVFTNPTGGTTWGLFPGLTIDRETGVLSGTITEASLAALFPTYNIDTTTTPHSFIPTNPISLPIAIHVTNPFGLQDELIFDLTLAF